MVLPASYLILTLYTLLTASLPAYGLGDNYFLIDHLSLYEILIASSIFLLAAVYSRQYIKDSIFIHEMDEKNLNLFYVAFNLLLVAVVYAFLADNLALFWILAELTTAFSAVLIVMLNAPKNIGATLKYIFITTTCMLFAFIGLILIFTLTEDVLGAGTLNWSALMSIAGNSLARHYVRRIHLHLRRVRSKKRHRTLPRMATHSVLQSARTHKRHPLRNRNHHRHLRHH